MVLRINPARQPLWRNETDLQLGVGKNAVRLSNLTMNQQRLLQMLYKGIPNTYFKALAKEYAAEDAEALLDLVKPALLQSTNYPTDEDFVAKQFAEICRAQSSYNHSANAVIANRKSARVYLSNGDGVGQLISNALRNSGVVSIGDQAEKNFDVAILIGQHAFAPSAYACWLSRMVPHVAVLFDEEGVLVTPIIEPGKTACLSCYHEKLTTADPAWPALASQLLFSKQKLDDSTSKLFGAAIAVSRVLSHIDGLGAFGSTEPDRSAYRMNIAQGSVRKLGWSFAPNCLCKQT